MAAAVGPVTVIDHMQLCFSIVPRSWIVASKYTNVSIILLIVHCLIHFRKILPIYSHINSINTYLILPLAIITVVLIMVCYNTWYML